MILEIDGKPIKSARDVIDIVSGQAGGERVRVTCWRDGERRSAEVTVGELGRLGGQQR